MSKASQNYLEQFARAFDLTTEDAATLSDHYKGLLKLVNDHAMRSQLFSVTELKASAEIQVAQAVASIAGAVSSIAGGALKAATTFAQMHSEQPLRQTKRMFEIVGKQDLPKFIAQLVRQFVFDNQAIIIATNPTERKALLKTHATSIVDALISVKRDVRDSEEETNIAAAALAKTPSPLHNPALTSILDLVLNTATPARRVLSPSHEKAERKRKEILEKINEAGEFQETSSPSKTKVAALARMFDKDTRTPPAPHSAAEESLKALNDKIRSSAKKGLSDAAEKGDDSVIILLDDKARHELNQNIASIKAIAQKIGSTAAKTPLALVAEIEKVFALEAASRNVFPDEVRMEPVQRVLFNETKPQPSAKAATNQAKEICDTINKSPPSDWWAKEISRFTNNEFLRQNSSFLGAASVALFQELGIFQSKPQADLAFNKRHFEKIRNHGTDLGIDEIMDRKISNLKNKFSSETDPIIRKELQIETCALVLVRHLCQDSNSESYNNSLKTFQTQCQRLRGLKESHPSNNPQNVEVSSASGLEEATIGAVIS